MFEFTVDFQEQELLHIFFNSNHDIASSGQMTFSPGAEGDVYLEVQDIVYDPDDPRYYRHFVLVLHNVEGVFKHENLFSFEEN